MTLNGEQIEVCPRSRLRSLKRIGLIFAIVGLVYYLGTVSFFQVFETRTTCLVSPIQGLAPVICLYYGGPAIAGCTLAQALILICQPLGAANQSFFTLVVLVVFYGLSYYAWHAIFRKADNQNPRIHSTGSLAAVLVLLYGSFTILIGLLGPNAQSYVTGELRAYHLSSANGFDWQTIVGATYAIYPTMGLLLLVIFERIPIPPTIPFWVRKSAFQKTRAGLTEQFALFFVGLIVVYLLVCAFSTIAQFASMFIEYDDPVLLYASAGGLFYGFIAQIMLTAAANTLIVLFNWILCIMVSYFLESRHTRPLEILAAITRRFPAQLEDYQTVTETSAKEEKRGKLIAHTDLSRFKPDEDVNRLSRDMDDMRISLVRYVDRVNEAIAVQERTDTELEVARSIQQGAIPHEFNRLKEIHSLEVAGVLQPARDVSGGFYDVFSIDDNHVGFLVGNVDGMGLAAALFMMRALTAIRESVKACRDLGEALTRANRTLCESDETPIPVSVLAVVLESTTGNISCVNAGQQPGIFLSDRPASHQVEPAKALGISPSQTYRTIHDVLALGEGMFFHTKSLIDTLNARGESFGIERLKRSIHKAESVGGFLKGNPMEIVLAVLDALNRFVEGTRQNNDVIMLVFRWTPEQICERYEDSGDKQCDDQGKVGT